jgi:hypothetical protein
MSINYISKIRIKKSPRWRENLIYLTATCLLESMVKNYTKIIEQ